MIFTNKVVIVTGGSSGIGVAIALAFAKEGADVAIIGRNETRLKNVSERISKIGKKPLVIKADLSEDKELRGIIKKTVENYGKLDILVNNAAITNIARIGDENLPEAFDALIKTNLRPAVVLTNLAVPHLIKSKGNIVNISSVGATSPLSGLGFGNAAGCTSKAGLDHFSRVAALELAEKGVRVNIVCPGPVETPIIEQTGITDWGPILDAATTLKVLTQPEEIADMVLYLASDKARSITGSTFVVDSGMKLKM